VRQVLAAGLEVAAGDRGVQGGHEAGGGLIQAGLLERIGVLPGRQVTIGHLGAGDLADDPGELGCIEGRTAELVGPVPSLVVKECCRCGGGVVLARGRRDLAVTGGAEDLAVFEVLAQRIGVDLGVVAVAQQRERHADLA
jgi:hypothetical protein